MLAVVYVPDIVGRFGVDKPKESLLVVATVTSFSPLFFLCIESYRRRAAMISWMCFSAQLRIAAIRSHSVIPRGVSAYSSHGGISW